MNQVISTIESEHSKSCCGGHEALHNHDLARTMEDISNAALIPIDGNVEDPVCGMSVTLGADKPKLSYKGDQYHFCNPKMP